MVLPLLAVAAGGAIAGGLANALDSAPTVPTGLASPMPMMGPAPLIGSPHMGGLNAAQMATLGLFQPEQATPYSSFQMPGGILAPIASQRQIAGGGVGGQLPTVEQAQAGQAPQLFGAPTTPQFGGMYGAIPPWLMPPPAPETHKIDPRLLGVGGAQDFELTAAQERQRLQAALNPPQAAGEQRLPSGAGNIFQLSPPAAQDPGALRQGGIR